MNKGKECLVYELNEMTAIALMNTEQNEKMKKFRYGCLCFGLRVTRDSCSRIRGD